MPERKCLSEEVKKKISDTHKARGVGKWMVGRKIPKDVVEKRSKTWRERYAKGEIKIWIVGKKLSESHKTKALRSLGKNRHYKKSTEHKRKLSIVMSGKTPWNKGLVGFNAGKKHWNWKDGRTPINKAIRMSFQYEEWRNSVFEKDSYTCQFCGEIGGYLQADHIKPFAIFPSLRLEVSNGQTLCFDCHKIKTKEDWKTFFNNYRNQL